MNVEIWDKAKVAFSKKWVIRFYKRKNWFSLWLNFVFFGRFLIDVIDIYLWCYRFHEFCSHFVYNSIYTLPLEFEHTRRRVVCHEYKHEYSAQFDVHYQKSAMLTKQHLTLVWRNSLHMSRYQKKSLSEFSIYLSNSQIKFEYLTSESILKELPPIK